MARHALHTILLSRPALVAGVEEGVWALPVVVEPPDDDRVVVDDDDAALDVVENVDELGGLLLLWIVEIIVGHSKLSSHFRDI